MINTNCFWASVTLSATLALASTAASADYPDRRVLIVVGQQPGGTTDALARLVAQNLQKKWGQPVIVENRPGANGGVAANFVARSAPDGYTLDWIGTPHLLAPKATRTYDPIKEFTPISKVAASPNFLFVSASIPVTDLKSLVDLAKTQPGRLNVGSPGTDSLQHIGMAYLMKEKGFSVTNVTYQSNGPAMVGLLGGEIQMLFGSYLIGGPHVDSGKLRAIAVSSGARSPLLPNVQTVAEASGIADFDVQEWWGVVGPAGLPKNLAEKVRDDIREITQQPEVADFMKKRGLTTIVNTPTEFASEIAHDMERWGRLQEYLEKAP